MNISLYLKPHPPGLWNFFDSMVNCNLVAAVTGAEELAKHFNTRVYSQKTWTDRETELESISLLPS